MTKRKIVIALLLSALPLSAAARDGYQNRPRVCDMADSPRLEHCNTWITTVKRPDIRTASCCGEGDAYVADNFEVVGEGLFAIITGDYPDVATTDAEGNTVFSPAPVHKGSRILIPLTKRNSAPEDAGNTSGHGVVFLLPYNGEVLCYFAPPLT